MGGPADKLNPNPCSCTRTRAPRLVRADSGALVKAGLSRAPTRAPAGGRGWARVGACGRVWARVGVGTREQVRGWARVHASRCARPHWPADAPAYARHIRTYARTSHARHRTRVRTRTYAPHPHLRVRTLMREVIHRPGKDLLNVRGLRHGGAMRYFTSDTHYGHANIIGFSNRPYRGLDEMNADLVHRVARVVEPGDEVWHLGDVALGPISQTLPILAQVPAPVTLVAGNHDRCHPSNGSRGERFVEIYREACDLEELILTNTRLGLTGGTEVNVSHFPYADPDLAGREDRHGDIIIDRFAPWRPVDDGSWLVCGHVHESWRQRGRMINVGVDAWGGNPVSEEEVLALIEAGPRDLPPLTWGQA